MTKHISWAKFALCVTVFLPNCIFAANGNQQELTLEGIMSLIKIKTPGELVRQLDLALSEFHHYSDDAQNRNRIWRNITNASRTAPIKEKAETLVMAFDTEVKLQQQRKEELSRIIGTLDRYGVQPTPGPVLPFA